MLHRHNEALLGAALADERVEALVADDLLVPTSDGDMSARELLEAGGGRAHVGMGEGGFEEMRFRALKVPIALGTRYAVLPFLRRWCEAQGAELVEIGTERGDGALFRRAELPEDERAWLAEQLAGRRRRADPRRLRARGDAVRARPRPRGGAQAAPRGRRGRRADRRLRPAPRAAAHGDDRGRPRRRGSTSTSAPQPSPRCSRRAAAAPTPRRRPACCARCSR